MIHLNETDRSGLIDDLRNLLLSQIRPGYYIDSAERDYPAACKLLAMLTGNLEIEENLGGNETSPSVGLPPKKAGPDSSGSSRGPSSSSGRGWVEIKTISGRQYAYKRWRDGKIKRSEYLGPVK